MDKFSIIIPVHNGGEYLKQAVQSILAQTFVDFNLLIVESGSTDDSIEYIQSIKDERVILHSTSEVFGIEDNWARIAKIKKNEFMTILGQDDILLPNYLETIINLIQNYPDASLYQTHFNQIDTKDIFIKVCQPMPEIETMETFLISILENKIDFMASGFVMRSKDYDAIGGIPIYPNLLFADCELFLELTQKGYLAVSPNICFGFRIHQSTTAISTDQKFQQAFGQFINYLEKLELENPLYKKIVFEHASAFILFYCKGLAHRLIRKPKRLRPGVSVADFIQQCKEYAQRLMPGKPFNPEKILGIKLAIWVDKSSLLRWIFLSYKKIYSKPVM